MHIQAIGAVTNPIKSVFRAQNENNAPQNQSSNGRQELPNDVFMQMEDGRWIGKTVDSKTGETMITISKNNWSNEGVLDSREVTRIPESNPTVGIKTITDYEHGAISKSLITNPLTMPVHKNLVTERKDPITGKTVAKETYTMSDVPGIYNVVETDALGRKKVISSAIKNKDGGIYISKNMTSLDGTTTTYRYTKDADGSHIRMFNQITDKNGKVLSTIDRTYDRVNENLAYSSVNGHKYVIEQKGKDTVVTDVFNNNQQTVLNEKTFKVPFYKKPLLSILGKVQGFTPEQTKEPVIKDLLRTLPGDALIDMSKDVRYIVPLKDNLDSAFMGYFGILNCNTDEFVVSHELGHSKDTYLKNEYKEMQKEIKAAQEQGLKAPEYLQNPIADNPQFQKEYLQEKAAFVKAFPSFQEEYIDYFIFETDGQADRGRKETVAETNAMNSQKPMPLEILAMRTQVLQQYFPRTIAVATKLTTPIAVADNNAFRV